MCAELPFVKSKKITENTLIHLLNNLIKIEKMKKLLQLSMLLFAAFSFGQTPIYQNLFDGNSIPTIGSGTFTFVAPGNPNALQYIADRSNVPAKSLQIFNQNATATIPSLPIGNAPRTVSFWFQNKLASNNCYIFSYGDASTGQSFALQLLSNLNQLQFVGWGAGNDLLINRITPINTWEHYAITYDGLTVKVYINAQLAGSRTTTLATVNSNFRLGKDPGNSASMGNTFIDELNIFNTALTDAQVATVFRGNTNKTPLQAGIPTNGLVYANHFTNGNHSDSSPSGAVITSFIGNSATAADSNSVANNARSFELDGMMQIELNNFPELKVGITSTNFVFSVSAQVKVDATYYASLPASQYITFFNNGGIYLRLLKTTAGASLQSGFQETNGNFVATASLSVSDALFTNNFLTVTLTNSNAAGMVLYANASAATGAGVSTRGVLYNPLAKLAIGYPNISPQSFKGIVDNVFIYDRQITAAEVSAIVSTNTLSNEKFQANNLKFNLYPNPANSILNVNLATDLQSVEIYSLQGQKVLSGTEKQINVSNLSSGMYMVRVTAIDGGVATQKFIKN